MFYKKLLSKSILDEEVSKEDIAKNKIETDEAIKFLECLADKPDCYMKEDNNQLTIIVPITSLSSDYEDKFRLAYSTMIITYDNKRTVLDTNTEYSSFVYIKKVSQDNEEDIQNEFSATKISISSAKKAVFQLLSNFKTSNKGRKKKELTTVELNKNVQEFSVDDLTSVQLSSLQNRLEMIETYKEDISNDKIELKPSGSKDISEYYKKETIAFGPPELIGDEMYRPVMSVKEKAERSILDFEKQQAERNASDTILPQEMAAAIIYKELQASVSGNPNQTTYITRDELKKNSNFMMKSSNIDYDKKIKDKEYKTDQSKKGDKGQFAGGTVGSEILKMVSFNPVEVLSPIVFAKMNLPIENWSYDEYGISSKLLVKEIYCKNNPNAFDEALIKFPLARNEKLIDSLILVPTTEGKYAQLGISTKGGADGKGAHASISSIFEFLLDRPLETNYMFDQELFSENKSEAQYKADVDQFIARYCSKIKTPKFKEFLERFIDVLCYIVLIGGIKPEHHEALVKSLSKGTMSVKKYAAFLNNNTLFSECVMRILDMQKYDFAQVNCLPKFTGDTFSYTYRIQYPAKFQGRANVEVAKRKTDNKEYECLAFHIVG